MEVAEVGAVAEDAGVGDIAAGKHGGAGGVAEGELAEGAVEADALRGEFVEVGGFGHSAGGAEFVAHVVGHDEEDVVFRGGVGGAREGGGDRESDEGQDDGELPHTASLRGLRG